MGRRPGRATVSGHGHECLVLDGPDVSGHGGAGVLAGERKVSQV